MKVFDFPVIKTSIFFITGFLVAYNFEIPSIYLLGLIASISIITLLLLKLDSPLKNIPLVSLIIVSGMYIFSNSYYEDKKQIKLFNKLSGMKVRLYGRVEKVDYAGNDGMIFYLNSHYLIIDRKSVAINQKILTRFNLRNSSLPQKTFQRIFSPGNYIRISGKVKLPDEPRFPGDFNNKFYLKSKGINYILESGVFDEYVLVKDDNSIFNYTRYLNDLRQKIKKQIEENFDGLTSAYIKGIFIAEKSDIPADVKEDFVNSGVIHVLAVSGLHTGYIALILIALTSRLRKFWKVLIPSLGLFIFAHLANLTPSVTRASIMSVVVLFVLLFERKNYLLNSIALAALIILTNNPLDIFNPGFQLSFVAVLSIALIYPVIRLPFENLLQEGWKKYLLDLILISIAVTIGTFPIVATYYQKFSFVSFLANIIIIPLTGIILGGIILNLIVLNTFPLLAGLYKVALSELIQFNFDIVQFFSDLPFAYTSIKNFALAHSISYYFLISMILIILVRKYKPVIKVAFIVFLILNYLIYFEVMNVNKAHSIKNGLIFCKMNNSNSVFIISQGKNLLHFYPKSQEFKSLVYDLNVLEKVLLNLNHKKIDYAYIASPAIWLKNNLKKNLNQTSIQKVNEQTWFFGNHENKNVSTTSRSNLNFRYIKNSFTTLVKIKNWLFIISPVEFEKYKTYLNQISGNVALIKPDLDTLVIKIGNNFKTQKIDFNNKSLKIYELNNLNLNESYW